MNSLKRINLIAGLNNSGKSSLLEALFIHCGSYNPNLILSLNPLRGLKEFKIYSREWLDLTCGSIFHNFDLNEIITLEASDDKLGKRLINIKILKSPDETKHIPELEKIKLAIPESIIDIPLISYPLLEFEYNHKEKKGRTLLIFKDGNFINFPSVPHPPFRAFFQRAREERNFNEEAELFGKLDKENKVPVLLNTLKIIEPRLKRLTTIYSGVQPVIYGDIGIKDLVPLPVMGEGMARILHLMLYICNTPGGIVIIDEIENGIHHSILSKLWNAINETSRELNTQVFATTHSLECIKGAYKIFKDDRDFDFGFHRLEKIKDTIQSISYDEETLSTAIESDMEVR